MTHSYTTWRDVTARPRIGAHGYASVHGALGAFSTNTQTYINASMEMAKGRRGALRVKQWPHGFGFS